MAYVKSQALSLLLIRIHLQYRTMTLLIFALGHNLGKDRFSLDIMFLALFDIIVLTIFIKNVFSYRVVIKNIKIYMLFSLVRLAIYY